MRSQQFVATSRSANAFYSYRFRCQSIQVRQALSSQNETRSLSNRFTVLNACHHRPYSSSPIILAKSSGNNNITINAPAPSTKSWERSAKLVKNTTINNKYLEHIRDVHDPSQHVKTIEDELRGTMGKALGKQGEKVAAQIRIMKEERSTYDSLVCRYHDDLSNLNGDRKKTKISNRKKKDIMLIHEIETCAIRYNDARTRATKARWELLVHRQAVGFTVGNHGIVHEMFPIDDALPLEPPPLPSESTEEDDGDSGETKSSVSSEKPKKVFGDQLDWWQRIGRWR